MENGHAFLWSGRQSARAPEREGARARGREGARARHLRDMAVIAVDALVIPEFRTRRVLMAKRREAFWSLQSYLPPM